MKLISRIDTQVAVFLALLLLMAAAVFQLAVKSAFGISSDWIPIYGYALSGGLVLALLAIRFPSALPWLLLASAVLPLMLLGHIAALFIVAFQWCAVFSIGVLFAPERLETNDHVAGALIVGYIVYSVVLLCLIHLGVFTAAVIATFHIFLIAAAGWFCRDKLQLGGILTAREQEETSVSAKLAVLIPIFAGSIILVLFAATPEDGSDAVAAYRPMIADIIHDGVLTIDPAKRTTNLMSLIELWGQTASATLAQDLHAAKIWNLSIFLFAFYVAASIGPRIGARLPDSVIVLGAAVTLVIPTFYLVTLSAFMDNSALLMTAIMVFWCMKILSPVTETDGFTYRNAIWAGLILGLAFLSKYTLVFPIVSISLILAGYLVFSSGIDHKLKRISVVAISALPLPIFYFIFVYLVTGNPFFPFENEKWQSPYFGVFQSPHNGYLHPALFWDMTINTSPYSVSGAVDGSLGLTFLFGAVLAVYIIGRALLRGDVGAGVWITATTFLIATVLLSWMQNSARYVSPNVAFLVPAVLYVMEGDYRRIWTAFFVVMLIGNFALIPRYGHGAGVFTFADAPKSAHTAVYVSKLDRQRVADDLSRQYGAQGRIVDLDASAVSIGETFENSWYDHLAQVKIGAALAQGAEGLVAFLDEQNIDAVVVGRKQQPRILALLKDSSRQVDHQGELIVFHLKDEIRFDRFMNVPDEGKLNYRVRPPRGTFAWQIDFSSRERVDILRIDIVGGRWRKRDSEYPFVDGRQSSWRSPLLSADGMNQSLIIFYQPPEGLEVGRAGIWYRPE